MIYSGVDLIRTSGQQAERLERLNVVDAVAPIQPTDGDKGANLDRDTTDALRRFAHFIKDESGTHKRKKPPLKVVKNSPPPTPLNAAIEAYKYQLENASGESTLGGILDVKI